MKKRDHIGVIRSRKSKDKQYSGHKFEDTKGVICKSKDKQYSGQTFADTKGVICKSKDKQYSGQKFEDTKGVIWNCKSKDRQLNGQKKKDKQWTTLHYTENLIVINMNPTKNRGWIHWKGKQFLLH